MDSGAEPELLSRPDARFGLVEELQPHLGPALPDPLLPLRQLNRRGEVIGGEPFLLQCTASFQDQERGMPFVDMPSRRRDPECAQRPRASDTEHYLLLNARVFVAAAKLVGDVTIFAAVGTEVGIEKKKPDMAHTGLPDSDDDLAAGKP